MFVHIHIYIQIYSFIQSFNLNIDDIIRFLFITSWFWNESWMKFHTVIKIYIINREWKFAVLKKIKKGQIYFNIWWIF